MFWENEMYWFSFDPCVYAKLIIIAANINVIYTHNQG